MSTQYDSISKQYKSFKDWPVWEIINTNALKHIGDVKGLKCLDLACGGGDWSFRLADGGAEMVVGMDISSGMIERAKESLATSNSSQKVRFEVRDCGKPFIAEEGPFDLIFAGWLLNYAPDFATQVEMWRNIRNNLKPGGRFVSITPNTWCPMFEAFDPSYGVLIETLKPVKDGEWEGTYVRNTMLTEPKTFSFDTWYWMHDFYEAAAAEGGMSNVKWRPTMPPEGKLKEDGYWDVWMLRPMINILTARRT